MRKELDSVPSSRSGLYNDEKTSSPGGMSIRGDIVHAVNKKVAKLHEIPMTLSITKIEETMRRNSRKGIDGETVLPSQNQRLVHQGQTKSSTHSATQAPDSVAIVVIQKPAVDSSFSRLSIELAKNSTNSADICCFPTTGWLPSH